MIEFDWAGRRWQAYTQRGLYWPDQRTLLIADPHFGKAASFRASGIPVPAQCLHETLDRLDALIERTRPRRLVILGDFWHAERGRTDETRAALAAWRARRARLRVQLVRGNHDRRAGDPPAELGIEVFADALRIDGLDLRHEPARGTAAAPILCGHVHPGVRLCDAAGTAVRLSCFHFSRHTGILPAFGAFTGLHRIRPRRGDRVLAIAEEIVDATPLLAC